MMSATTNSSSCSRYDGQLAKILEQASEIFYEIKDKSASIRELSRGPMEMRRFWPAKAMYFWEGFMRRRLPDWVDGSWPGSGASAAVANVRDGADLGQETIAIVD